MKIFALAATILLAGSAVAQTPPPPPGPPPTGCTSPESRQFDFWVGSWDLYPNGKDTKVAHSLIERLYMGCAIRENWMPLRAGGGGSLNSYVPKEKLWRQTWIDSSGARVEFKGGLQGRSMVLEGFWPGSAPGGKDGVTRMTYTPNPDGSVRQHGQVTTDNGKTWLESFDFIYRPAKAP
jgi:hypothetical protein